MMSWPCDFPETSCIDVIFLWQFPDLLQFPNSCRAKLADVFSVNPNFVPEYQPRTSSAKAPCDYHFEPTRGSRGRRPTLVTR
jgi:hypothetical protein